MVAARYDFIAAVASPQPLARRHPANGGQPSEALPGVVHLHARFNALAQGRAMLATAAGCDDAMPQGIALLHAFVPAVAAAVPEGSAIPADGSAGYGERAEALPIQVDQLPGLLAEPWRQAQDFGDRALQRLRQLYERFPGRLYHAALPIADSAIALANHIGKLRLREAGELARAKKFDYFTTTLSISPLKNAGKLNEIGTRIGEELGVTYLQSDFKKKNGYKRSTELSKEYGMYRQDYCGCVYSYRERHPDAIVSSIVEEHDAQP